jgi:aminopeptidase N
LRLRFLLGKYKEKKDLDCNYYVLRDNLKAKEQFKDVPRMLKAFEHWFGPYPFYEDSFKLEAPYLGMEHQSSVTYGNGFKTDIEEGFERNRLGS